MIKVMLLLTRTVISIVCLQQSTSNIAAFFCLFFICSNQPSIPVYTRCAALTRAARLTGTGRWSELAGHTARFQRLMTTDADAVARRRGEWVPAGCHNHSASRYQPTSSSAPSPPRSAPASQQVRPTALNITSVLSTSHLGQLSLLLSAGLVMSTGQEAVAVLFGWEGNLASQTLWYIYLRAQRPKEGRWAPRLYSFKKYGILYLLLLMCQML